MKIISLLRQRLWMLTAVLGSVLLFAACSQDEDPPAVSVISVDEAAAERRGFAVIPEPARPSPISFTDGTGQSLSLESFDGKVVLLNLWTTWCPPCREEMPTLDALQAELGGPGFEVVALSIDQDGPDVVQSFYDSIGLEHLRLYNDESGKAGITLGALGVPVTLLLDRNGYELARLSGVKGSTPFPRTV
jgi:thiol-disulfide isomerase/thioredoxin